MFQKCIIGLMALGALSANAFAAAGDIAVGGKSAQYVYGTLASRPEGVTRGQSKSWLGSRIDHMTLENILHCQVKHGWVFESFNCNLTDTTYTDIAGVRVISVGGDETNDILADLNSKINSATTLPIGGQSASRLFSKLSNLEGKDKTFYKKEGRTLVMKNPVLGVGINELYCQRTTGRILGASYKCYLLNTTIADSNAPVKTLERDPNDRKE